MEKAQGRIAAVAGFCFLLVLILFITAAAAYNMAGDRLMLATEMRRHSPPDVSGLPDERYPEMGRTIAEFLTGQKPYFQYYFTGADGELVLCFQIHEAEHMMDCRRLVQRTGTLRWILGAAALVLAGAGVVLQKYRKRFAAGMLAGVGLTAAVFLAVLAWGLIDFDGLFTTFHRIAFTNDGWLLNPETDMLIRLMPTSFFVSLGIRLLLAVLATAAVCFTAAVTLRMIEDKDEKTEEHPAEETACDAG